MLSRIYNCSYVPLTSVTLYSLCIICLVFTNIFDVHAVVKQFLSLNLDFNDRYLIMAAQCNYSASETRGEERNGSALGPTGMRIQWP